MSQPKTLEEKIADALRSHAKTGQTRDGNPWKDACYCGGWTYSMADHQANVVMALIRGMTRSFDDHDDYYADGAEDRPGGVEKVIFDALKKTDGWTKIQAARYLITVLSQDDYGVPGRQYGDDYGSGDPELADLIADDMDARWDN